MSGTRLLGLEGAVRLSRNEAREIYSEHMNPGLASMLHLLDFDRRYIRALGASVWDADGNEYLDCLGAYGALNLGHNHPALLTAIRRVEEMPNLLQATINPIAAAAAHDLAAITPQGLTRVFFGNSGAEAVEGALKLARAATGRSKVLYTENSFHGKTYGALSVTGRAKYQKPFAPLVPDMAAIPFNDLPALEAALQVTPAAAFIVEPVQGEGGVRIPSPGYLAEAKLLCESHGALLIVDEVQTGFGRTGAVFACEHDRVAPDIMCLAKSLGGGAVPVGAFVTRPDIWDKAYGGWDRSLLHTSTFGGNTRAMAAVLAAIEETVNENLAEAAREKGQYLLDNLRRLAEGHPLVREVRGKGLLIGIEFDGSAGALGRLAGAGARQLTEEYVGSLVAGELLGRHRIITAYTLNNPNVIRLEPPLVITEEQVGRVIAAFGDVLSRVKGFGGLALAGAKAAVSGLLGRK